MSVISVFFIYIFFIRCGCQGTVNGDAEELFQLESLVFFISEKMI